MHLSWQKRERLYTIRALSSGQLARQIRRANRLRGGRLDAVPVFAQHAPGPKYFADKLDHLGRNGYETLDTSGYAAWLSGQHALDRPSVMLTFDDGQRRFKEITFPLLQARGYRSVLFVCPGLVELASCSDGPLGAFVARDMLTWDELRELHATGLVDIQSHGMWHHRVATSEVPLSQPSQPGEKLFQVLDMFPPDGRIEAVLTAAGSTALVPRYPSYPFYQCRSGDHAADLRRSKELIEQNLSGHRVRAFAFPWWNGVDSVARAALAEGYELVFHGMRGIFGSPQRAAIDPLCIGRMSFDWITCLPGTGAKPIRALFAELMKGEHADDTA